MDLQSPNTPTIEFSFENVVKAFEVLLNPENSKETIGKADNYLG